MKPLRYLFVLLFLLVGCGLQQVADDGHEFPSDNDAKPQDSSGIKPESEPRFDIDVLNPENFVNGVSNPYFSIVPGRKLTLEGQTIEGIKIHRELLSSDHTKKIDGVNTLGVWEREWQDDTLVSDTKKWYAEDKAGNVWIFGEDDSHIFGGFTKSAGESWQSGVGEAKAGIVVPKNAIPGDRIESEFNGYYEQRSEVLAVGEKVNVPIGAFNDCIKISNVNVKTNYEQHRYYCKEIGNLSLEQIPHTFAKVALSKVEDHFPIGGMDVKYPEYRIGLPEEAAKKIAIKEVDGGLSVVNISVKLWQDTPAYAVDVINENDKIKTVFIDIQSGLVLNRGKKK